MLRKGLLFWVISLECEHITRAHCSVIPEIVEFSIRDRPVQVLVKNRPIQKRNSKDPVTRFQPEKLHLKRFLVITQLYGLQGEETCVPLYICIGSQCDEVLADLSALASEDLPFPPRHNILAPVFVEYVPKRLRSDCRVQ